MAALTQTTHIHCSGARHAVSLREDGTVVCPDCPDALDLGAALAGQLMLGGTGGVRGCAGLVALVHGAPGLARELRGSKEPRYGVWRPLVEAYRTNRVFLHAVDRVEEARWPLHERVRSALLDVDLGHGLGRRQFDDRLRFMWDVPVSDLTKYVVASFSDDRWDVPYAPDWSVLADSGAAVIDGRFVCGRDADGTVYAITKHPDDEAWWVMPHQMVPDATRLDGGKLVELAS